MNRAQLFTEVLADLNREDKADRCPGWLESAEFRINENLRDDRMIKHAVLPVTDAVFPVPPDFQQAHGVLSIRSGSEPATPGPVLATLRYFPTDQFNDGYADPFWAEPPRPPVWYTVRGRSYELSGWNAPGPFLVDLWYFGNLKKLVTDTDDNWLLAGAPQIYKNMMLHFGFAHLQEFDTAERYLTYAVGEITAMNDRTTARAEARQGPLIKRPVQGYGQNRFRRR